ncbi:hypothetical protein ARAQ110984_07625 [Arcobacter aquimarinus]|uniref:Uncharacterized protein n=1 Tax=Arcobacter aquimarinus TaxID=1315211 RepID=A0AAE7B570_9BACT|nr:hypothetical protein AAQM_1308 [Arcobacter aquimarinus]
MRQISKSTNLIYKGKNLINIINQAVDTYKEHLYPTVELTEGEIIDYNDFVLDLIELKKEVQKLVSKNGDERYITEIIHNQKFHIMATTQKGFAVTIKNGDVSISFKRFKKVSKQPCIKIEYRAEYLARYGYVKCVTQTTSFLKNILSKFKQIASEIHLCTDIQGYDFDVLDFFRMKSTTRKNEFHHDDDSTNFFEGKKYTGFTLGKGDFMMRIYNKTHEINKFPEKSFVKPCRWFVSPNYDENKEVWRIEVQIRREKLKHYFNDKKFLDDSINCLNSVPDIWSLFMKKFHHIDLNEDSTIEVMRGKKKLKNGSYKLLSKYAIRKRFQRGEITPLWKEIQTFFHTKGRSLTYLEEVSKPSALYVKNSFKSLVSTLTKHLRGRFDKYALADIILEANNEEKEKTGLTIFDTAKIKTIDYFNQVNHIYQIQDKNGFGVQYEDDFKQYENDLENNILALFSVVVPEEKPTIETLKAFYEKFGCLEKRKELLCV